MSEKLKQRANEADEIMNRVYHRLHTMLLEHGEDRTRPISNAMDCILKASRLVRPLMDAEERKATSWP